VTWYRKSELATLPVPTWLVEHYLLARTLAQLSGPSKAGKTFLYTDWACALACEGKRVAVLLGEGLYGMNSRICAWENHHQRMVPNNNLVLRGGISALPDPSAMRILRAELERLSPLDLIVFDTFARFMAGFDENSTTDVGAAMENVAVLMAAAGGATGLLVTHFGWGGNRQRGSSALYGACDTVLYLVPTRRATPKTEGEEQSDEKGYILELDPPKSKRSRLTVDKHRDAPDEVPAVTFERTDVEGTGSCVYLPVKKRVKAETNGHGKVVDLRSHRTPSPPNL
jgi:AAA domain-containing protein